MRALRIIFVCMISFSMTSCVPTLMAVMGFKNPKQYSEKEIAREARRQNIPTKNLYFLDPSLKDTLFSLDTSIKGMRQVLKNHYQPATAMYFDSSGTLISFHVNCYAKGYRSNWNAYGYFDEFPPKSAAPADTLFSLDDVKKYIRPLGQNHIDFKTAKYTSVVFFNRIVRGRNRRLVKEVKRNAKLCVDKEISIIYVNNDGFMYRVFDSTL